MATGIDIWIAQPGSACAVDDHDWIVAIEDAHGNPYSWAGDSYASLPAPASHWAGAIPPGTYVVRARRKDGSRDTDRAIVAINGGEVHSVRLWVAGDQPPHKAPEGECEVTIGNVRAEGRDVVQSAEVSGSASGCDQVQVELLYLERDVKVKTSVKGGTWSARVDLAQLEVPCGKAVQITVRCRQHPECMVTERIVLRCGDDRL